MCHRACMEHLPDMSRWRARRIPSVDADRDRGADGRRCRLGGVRCEVVARWEVVRLEIFLSDGVVKKA